MVPCFQGQSEVIDANGNSKWVSGTLTDASCSEICTTSSGVVDECGICRCKERMVASCTDANCAEGMTASLDANGNCICARPNGVNPAGPTQSACLGCYIDCIESMASGSTSLSSKFSPLTSTAKVKNSKTDEMVANTCQRTCDNTYKTNVYTCACANTQCGTDETPSLQADLSCKCVPKTQLPIISTGIDLAALSSQWSEHHEGTPTNPSVGSSSTGCTCSPGWYNCGSNGACVCCTKIYPGLTKPT